ncbi:MAG: hypothetical protein L6R41_000042 [Letrouitia leprolyta]|nr:MAG: hypothetical protein L6R41_000042 [Letrouitia leprolyta]
MDSVCKPSFPLQIAVEAPLLQENDVLRVIWATQYALDDQNDFSLHHLRLRIGSNYISSNSSQHTKPFQENTVDGRSELQEALTITLVPQSGLTAPRAELQTQSASLDILYPPHLVLPASSTSFPLAIFIAAQLQDLFAEERALISRTLIANPGSTSSQSAVGPGQSSVVSDNVQASSSDLTTRLASRTTLTLRYAPTYHVTISLFSSNGWPSSWDIESAISEYLAPLLRSASVISGFKVDTQTQLYASFSPSVREPEYDANREVWTLREEDLSGFINAAEWPLSPSIGTGPTINFIIYVPNPSTSPLVIKGSQANSWLIPQWGGVMILNPPYSARPNQTQAAGLSKEDIRPALLIFSRQLMSFLGAPQSPSSIPLQLKTLTRVRAASLLQ